MRRNTPCRGKRSQLELPLPCACCIKLSSQWLTTAWNNFVNVDLKPRGPSHLVAGTLPREPDGRAFEFWFENFEFFPTPRALVDWEIIQSKNWHGAHRQTTNRMCSARGLCCRARAGVSSLVPWGFRGRGTIKFKCLKLGPDFRLSFVIKVRWAMVCMIVNHAYSLQHILSYYARQRPSVHPAAGAFRGLARFQIQTWNLVLSESLVFVT